MPSLQNVPNLVGFYEKKKHFAPFSELSTIFETIERITGATIGPKAAKTPPKILHITTPKPLRNNAKYPYKTPKLLQLANKKSWLLYELKLLP